MSSELDDVIRDAARDIAEHIGKLLEQKYVMFEGKWYLSTLGKRVRELTPEEVVWHTERGHYPFVPDGKRAGDPTWWEKVVS